jgi:predicted DNA-binding transcriptional regulator YafY
VGRKSQPETLVAIYQAFLQSRTWKQTELADHIGIKPPALRQWLQELERTGMPLDREEDHPHVFWSVPPEWFPGGMLLRAEDVAELLRQLFRLPRSMARDKLIRRLLEAGPRGGVEPERERAVVAPEASDAEESVLPVAEDSVIQRRTLAFRYFSASRGVIEARRASVQRVVVGPPARFVAVCHRDGALKWFRLERVTSARLDASDAYQNADAEKVATMLRESVDGFQHGQATMCSFVVMGPEARWVVENLPAPMTQEPVADGVRLSARTAGLLPLARFVVGLGAAARTETPELRAAVAALARGALKNGTQA